MNFGEKMRAIRLSRELTQEELAALLGTTKQTISRYENSEREPNLRTARDIAEKLNIDINILADDDCELSYMLSEKFDSFAPHLSEDALEVARSYSQLSTDKKNMVRRLLDLEPLADSSPSANKLA